MKSSKQVKTKLSGAKRRKNEKGVALVMVVAVIALATVMIMAFFDMAVSESEASNTYSDGLQAQQVAEQSVNLVIAQIRKATSDPDKAWASQPGAIRTWTNNGKLTGYKLYSDDLMVDHKSNDKDFASKDFEEFEDGWNNDEFVDLNTPVIRGTKVYYPIVDPKAKYEPRWRQAINGKQKGIEGFDYNYDSSYTVKGGELAKKVEEVSKVEHLSMPVRWIYQLANGALGYLEGGRFEPFQEGSVPTQSNPIVGRFAFWADDETTKLNLNVHAGGLAWDTPRTGGETDMDMGRFQPAQNEWQRYPGHPATTSLAPVLAPGVIKLAQNKDAMEMIFESIPKVVGGGSESGTRKIDIRNRKERNGLIPDNRPLFPSVDEFVMKPNRDTNPFPQSNGRPARFEVMREQLERARFFLTTTSRAPETTLFNTPRIATWPISGREKSARGAEMRTKFDKLIAFCASAGGKSGGTDSSGDISPAGYAYYFQRENADDDEHDYQNIERNRQLYRYIIDMMNKKIPGVGHSFAEKYPREEHYHLATMMFDYIRSVNLHDDSLFGEDWERAFDKKNSNTHRTFTNPRALNNSSKNQDPNDIDVIGQSRIHKGHGQVTPIRIKEDGHDTKGFGRFYTLKDVGVHVICVADGGGKIDQLGGEAAGPRNPGFSVYGQNGVVEDDAERQHSNFPPMPKSASYSNYDSYPNWLKEWLRDYEARNGGRPWQSTEIADQVEMAFEPENWNWNLIYNRTDQNGKYIRIDPEDDDVSEVMQDARNGLYPSTLGCFQGSMPSRVGHLNLKKEHYMRVAHNQKLVQAGILFNLFCPSMGWVPINPDMSIEINLVSEAKGGFAFSTLGPGSDPNDNTVPFDQLSSDPKYNGYHEIVSFPSTVNYTWFTNDRQSAWHHRHAGGVLPFTYVMGDDRKTSREFGPEIKTSKRTLYPTGRYSPLDPEYYEGGVPRNGKYLYLTSPFRVKRNVKGDPNEPAEMAFTGGSIIFEIKAHGDSDGGKSGTNGNYDPEELSAPQTTGATDVQRISFNLPSFRVHPPDLVVGRTGYINEFNEKTSYPVSPMAMWSLGIRGAAGVAPGEEYSPEMHTGRMYRLSSANGAILAGERKKNGDWVGDVVKSMGVLHGDLRLAAASRRNAGKLFGEHYLYDEKEEKMAHDMSATPGWRYAGAITEPELGLLPGINYRGKKPAGPIGDPKKYSGDKVNRFGDFDNGMGLLVDGPYINKPDEGNSHSLFNRTELRRPTGQYDFRRDFGDYPYFVRDYVHEAGSPSYFSPNRIMSGPGMFGSLPARPEHKEGAWATLLFRPDSSSGHYGGPTADESLMVKAGIGDGSEIEGEDPADHYLLDMFWMPVVEPYAISEPLSTAGKVNLNYQMLPFRHVKRDTALRGIFRSELVVQVPTPGYKPDNPDDNKVSRNRADPSFYSVNYKHNAGRGRGWHWRDRPRDGELQGKRLRGVIVEEDTLEQFEKLFDEGEVFKSASQICEMHLVPQQYAERLGITSQKFMINSYVPDVEDMENGRFWEDHALTGDNSRERPYGNIYNRVTTKSNTFKVHFWGQVLKQGRGGPGRDYSRWDSDLDTVVSGYRGSSIVERYIDPNDPNLPDYADTIGGRTASIDEFYRFRVVNPTRFAP